MRIARLPSILVGLGLGLTALPATAFAYNYQTCIKIDVATVDAGYGITAGPDTGLTEDHWTTCNSGCSAIARGVVVEITRNGVTIVGDTATDPVTGCFNWTSTYTTGFDVKVWGKAYNVKDTFVRVHDGAPDDYSTNPGTAISFVLDDMVPTHNGSNTYYAGAYQTPWTVFASMAFGIYRYDTSNDDKQIHVAFDANTCNTSSIFSSGATASITSGRHYISIADDSCGGDEPRQKNTVTHELGHALLRLHSNLNGKEDVDDTNAVTPDLCTFGGDYSMRSKEWSSIGFKEGFAHFVAARIWNNKASSGTFRFQGATYDLERYNFGAGTGEGGRLMNECCVTGCSASWLDAGTNEDWMRFFWDFYTNESVGCPTQPDGLDMYDLYKKTRTNGGLVDDSNYFTQMETAVTQIGLPACLSGDGTPGRFDEYAEWNGINND